MLKGSEIHSCRTLHTHLASLLGSALKGILIVAVCKVNKTRYSPGFGPRMTSRLKRFRLCAVRPHLGLHWGRRLWSRHGSKTGSQNLYLHPSFPQGHSPNGANHSWRWLNLSGIREVNVTMTTHAKHVDENHVMFRRGIDKCCCPPVQAG